MIGPSVRVNRSRTIAMIKIAMDNPIAHVIYYVFGCVLIAGSLYGWVFLNMWLIKMGVLGCAGRENTEKVDCDLVGSAVMWMIIQSIVGLAAFITSWEVISFIIDSIIEFRVKMRQWDTENLKQD